MTRIKELIQGFTLNQEILGRVKRYVGLSMYRPHRWEHFTEKTLSVAEAEEIG